MAKHDDDNRSNQLNPNNDAYWSSREENYPDDDDDCEHGSRFTNWSYPSIEYEIDEPEPPDVIELNYPSDKYKLIYIDQNGNARIGYLRHFDKQSTITFKRLLDSGKILYAHVKDRGQCLFESTSGLIIPEDLASCFIGLINIEAEIIKLNESYEKVVSQIANNQCYVIYTENDKTFKKMNSDQPMLEYAMKCESSLKTYMEARNKLKNKIPVETLKILELKDEEVKHRIGLSYRFWISKKDVQDMIENNYRHHIPYGLSLDDF